MPFRLAPLPLALVVFLCGLAAGWTCHWILVLGLTLVWVVGRLRLCLLLCLLLAAGWFSGFSERQICAFLDDPPYGHVLLSGEVNRVEVGAVGMRLQSERGELVMLRLPFGWADGHLRQGDVLHVVASWEPVASSLNPGSPGSLRRLRADGYRGQVAEVRIMLRQQHGKTSRIQHLRAVATERLQARVNLLFGAPASPWVHAMLLGDRSDLPQADQEAFRRSGLAHLLAVSGLHVGVLFGTITLLGMGLVSRLPVAARWQTRALSALLVLVGAGYGVLLGWPASATRALLMLLLASLFRAGGRSGWLARTWMLALSGATVFGPERMIHDLGAQLSFAAVGGLVAVPWLMRWPMPRPLRSLTASLIAGTAASLATAPLLLKTFGWVPTGSVITGLIGIPLASFFLVSAFVALILPVGGNVLAPLAEQLLDALLWWARASAAPWHPLLRAEAEGWMWLALVTCCVIWISWPSLSRVLRVAGLLGCMLVFTVRPLPDVMTVTLLDVGQGESLVLEWGGEATAVVDTGPGPASGAVVSRYLALRGTRQVELLLSHGDRDHVAGTERMTEQSRVSGVRAPWEDPSTPGPPTLLGNRWSPAEGVRVMVLHPQESGRDNAHSMVLLVALPGLRMLFTGDIDRTTESLIVSRWQTLWNEHSVHVLKLAHHGSSTSTGPELLERFHPAIALFSAGKDNAFGHPHPEVLRRLASSSILVHGTLGGGALQVRWNGYRLDLRRWQDGAWRRTDPPLQSGSVVSVRQKRRSGDWR